ncbi:immunoglobulin-like domain-containing protein, partial [Blautia obeum]
KDGDVSSSLTVESVYEIDDSHVAVTYTAKDNSNNITKQKYEMEMDPSDAGKASKDTSAFGEKTDNADAAATTGVDAEQSENPDTADHAEENADVAVVEETPTPTPEVDEAAAEKEKQEAEANTMPDQNPRIYLTDYLIKVPVGTSVDLLSYVSEIKDDSDDAYALWRKVQITGEVNSAVPGTYKCTYYVIDSQNNISNNAVLTVIVE